MTKSKLYLNFAIPDSLNMSEKNFNSRFAGMVSGVGVPAKRNFEVSNRSFQRCKFNGICHQDSLPTNESFISIQSKDKPLIPCHLHPMIQTTIHRRMIPLVMKMMTKCCWNKINKIINNKTVTIPCEGLFQLYHGREGLTSSFCHGCWLHYP